jgi:hypothetical protein
VTGEEGEGFCVVFMMMGDIMHGLGASSRKRRKGKVGGWQAAAAPLSALT